MVLPAGVTTALVYKKAPVSFGGSQAKVLLEITPSVRLVHSATGTPLADYVEQVNPEEGGVAQVLLPHTDQAGFQDEAGNAFVNWHYTARIRYEKNGHQPKTLPLQSFQVPSGQTEVDLSLIPHGTPAIATSTPILGVSSVAGFAGSVTAEQIAAKLGDTFIPWRSTTLYLTDPRFGISSDGTEAAQATIKAAFDANPGAEFYAPPGDYRLDSTLVITAGIALHCAIDARFYANAPMGKMVDYTTTDGSFVHDRGIWGGLWDGNLKADIPVSIQNVLRFSFNDFTIRDGIRRGIKAGPEGAEIIARNGRIYNTTATNVADNIAIEDTMGDNYWTDIVITDWTQAVKDTAASYWLNVHAWLGADGLNGAQIPARYPTSIAFNATTKADFSACYADTYRTAFKSSSNGSGYTPKPRFINCNAFWAPTNVHSAFANANPGVVFDNTDGVGLTADRTSMDGLPEAPVSFLTGPSTKFTARGSINNGFVNGVADYLDGVKQGDSTFSPTFSATTTAGAHAYVVRNGRMTVDQNTVTYNIQVSATMGSTLAGALRLGGLPVPEGATGVRPSSGVIGYASGVNVEGVFTGGGTSTFDLIPVYRTPTGAAEIWANDLQGDVVEIWVTIQANVYKN
jgi:hypothetical protein